MHLPLRTSLRLDVFMDDTWKSETLLTNETLLVVSNKDSVSSPDRVLARTQPLRAGPHTTTLRLEQSNHIALYDEDKELAIEAILTFFDSEPAPVDS
jgi:esterase/lipase